MRLKCRDCGRSWRSRPDQNLSVLSLWVRRTARRWGLRSDWSARQGMNACPSCFSKQVRDVVEVIDLDAGTVFERTEWTTRSDQKA